MANNIPTSILKQFFIDTVGNNLNKRKAQELNIEDEYKAVADELDENNIDFNEIINTSLYEEFATLYVTEQEKKQEAKDKEKEKEEQMNIKNDKNTGF